MLLLLGRSLFYLSYLPAQIQSSHSEIFKGPHAICLHGASGSSTHVDVLSPCLWDHRQLVWAPAAGMHNPAPSISFPFGVPRKCQVSAPLPPNPHAYPKNKVHTAIICFTERLNDLHKFTVKIWPSQDLRRGGLTLALTFLITPSRPCPLLQFPLLPTPTVISCTSEIQHHLFYWSHSFEA